MNRQDSIASPRPDPRLNIADAHSNRTALVLVNNYSNLSGPALVDQHSNREYRSHPQHADAVHSVNGVRVLPLSKVNSNMSNASHQQFGHKFEQKLSVQHLAENTPEDVSAFTISLPSSAMSQIKENSNLQHLQDPGTPEPGDDTDIDDIHLSFDDVDRLDPSSCKMEGSLDSGDSVRIDEEEEEDPHHPLAVAAAAMAMRGGHGARGLHEHDGLSGLHGLNGRLGHLQGDENQSMDSVISGQMEGGVDGINMEMVEQFGSAAGSGSVSISIASTVPRIPRPKSLTSLRDGGDVEYSLDGLAAKDMMLVVSPSRHHRRQYSLGVQQDIQNCMSVPGASSSKRFKFDGHSDHKKSHSISSHHFRI